MKTDKVRNFTDEELRHQEHELNDQLFKLKFQLNMGQTESLKKIRGLRKDIARVKTIGRERELAATGTSGGVATVVAPKAVAAKTVATKAKRKTEKK
jgi:large subunit ribosomal protein L29